MANVADIAALHRNEVFQDLFTESASPVAEEIRHLHSRLLYDRTMKEEERRFLQGKLAGINAVQQLVEALHRRTAEENPFGATPRQEAKAVLAHLPRSLQGINRAFPARRAAQGGR